MKTPRFAVAAIENKHDASSDLKLEEGKWITAMKNIRGKKTFIALSAVLLLGVLGFVFSATTRQDEQPVISEFGKYHGYTQDVYDGAQRVSDYLALSDGTRLAYDLFLPVKDGVATDKPLPVLFLYTPYGRAWTVYDEQGNNTLAKLGAFPWYYEPVLRIRSWFAPNRNVVMDVLSTTEWLGEMVQSGYAVVVVDRPGTGASFGKLSTIGPQAGASETDEILNWIAAQPWCDGNIGMFGDSIQAQIQFQAASTGNPHLKAILPATTWLDQYSAVMFPGGVRNKALGNMYTKLNNVFDALATPVDGDTDGTLLAQARAERNNAAALADEPESSSAFPFRDSLEPNGEYYWEAVMLYPLLERINRSGIPVYLINGWYDIYARDNFMTYANLTVPKRLLVRPTDHSNIEAPGSDIDYAAEARRWFDYWLKGIDNGIMDEAPIHYYLQGEDQQAAWQATYVWPLAQQEMTRFYFGPGVAGESASMNNGTLVPAAPTASEAADMYTVDYTTTTGKTPHWSALATAHEYPNMRAHDAKALTYTTPPLEAAVRVIGHPVVHVWLRSDAPDLDVFAYLEEVDENGNATYITQGVLRASQRSLSQAPFDNFGLPWHNYFQSEAQAIPAGEPVELVFDLLPTAYQFSPGKHVRITLACADADNFDTPRLNPAPTLQVLRDAGHASYVDMPVVREP